MDSGNIQTQINKQKKVIQLLLNHCIVIYKIKHNDYK